MKKVLSLVALVMISVIIYAFNDEGAKVNQESKNEVKDSEVVVMDKDMFSKTCSITRPAKNGNTKATSLPS